MRSLFTSFIALFMIVASIQTASAQSCDANVGTVAFTSTGGNPLPAYDTEWLLTDTAGAILQISAIEEFVIALEGAYTIYELNYDTLSGVTGNVVGDTITNITGACFDTSSLPIQVCAIVTAVDDVDTTLEDTPVTVDVLANDNVTGDGFDTSSVAIIAGGDPVNGSVVNNGDGTFTYTPDPDFVGADLFTYVVCDSSAPIICDTADVTIWVFPVPDTTYVTLPEDSMITVCTDTLTNLQGGPFTLNICGLPDNGTAVETLFPCVEYTPDPDYFGNDTVCIATCNLAGFCDTTYIIYTITPVNDPPVAVDDNTTTPEDVAVDIDVIANDSDLEGPLDSTSVNVTNGPSNGSTSVDPMTGEVTYTPDPDFVGTDVFEYAVCDTGMPVLCDTALVTIIVTPVPDTNYVTIDEDGSFVECMDTLTNFAGPVTSVSLCGTGDNGTAVELGLPCVEYTANPDYNGNDTICIITCSGTLCDTQITVITITPVNDPPIAVDDTETTPEDTPVVVDVVANDTDIEDGTPLDPCNVTIVDAPSNGSISFGPAPGCALLYDPAIDFYGTDTFTYEVCDADGACDTAEVIVTVTPVNDPPIAIDDATTTPEDTPLDVDVLDLGTDDSDVEGDILITSVGDDPLNPTSGTTTEGGTVTIDDNGTPADSTDDFVVYTPAPDYFGNDTFYYVITDSDGATDTAEVLITVTPVNDPPIAVDDTETTPEDTPVTVDVVGNDSDVEDGTPLDPCNVSIVDAPANGNITFGPPVACELTYTPDADFVGTDVFTYEVCDDNGACDTAEVVITVTPVIDTTYVTLPEDSMITVCTDTLTNLPGGPFTVNVCGLPDNGTAIETIFPCVEYTPNADYVGNDTICIATCNAAGLCDTTMVIYTVTPVNDPPVAVDDNETTNEDTPIDVPVLANDSDIDGNLDTSSISTTGVLQPANGATAINADGTITYTPDADFVGTDQFEYIVCDDGLGDATTGTCDYILPPGAIVFLDIAGPSVLSLTIDGIPTPLFTGPWIGFFDPTGIIYASTLQMAISSNITASSVTVTPSGLAPVISFDVLVTGSANVLNDITWDLDGLGFLNTLPFTQVNCVPGLPATDVLCDTALVTVTVLPQPDTNYVSIPEDSLFVECMDTLTNFDGPVTSVSICDAGDNGTATEIGIPCVEYVADADYFGNDTICIISCSGTLCDTQITVITISPVNDPPVAIDDAETTPEDTPLAVDVLDLGTPDSDVESNILITSVGSTSGSNDGTTTAGGTVTYNNNGTPTDSTDDFVDYVPPMDFNGTDTFYYVITDAAGATDTAEVIITVTPVNDPPVATDDAETTQEDTPVTVDVTDNDDDPNDPLGDIDPTSVTIVPGSGPDNGMVSVDPVTGDITYTPADDWFGTDTFEYVVCDDGNPLPALCDTAEVVITVETVNDPPVAVDDVDATTEDVTIDVDVVSNDSDTEDGLDTASINVTVQPANGTATANTDGTIEYDPDPDFVGTDVFEYAICDTGSPVLCDTALVTVTVNPVIDTTYITVLEDSMFTVCLDTLTNLPGGIFTQSFCGLPTNGTASETVLPCIEYAPNADYFGPDEICVVSCNSGGICDTTIIVIDVIPVNDPPIAVDDQSTTPEDTPVDIDVIANDFDLDGNLDSTTVTVLTGPTNGSTAVDPATGVVTYTPDTDFVGTDTFTYEICDDGVSGSGGMAVPISFIGTALQNHHSFGGGFDPASNEFWFPNWSGSTVSRYNATTHTFLGNFDSGVSPMMQLWKDASSSDYYTANWGSQTITRRSGNSAVWSYNIGAIAAGVSGDADYIYAYPRFGGTISVIDKNTGLLDNTIALTLPVEIQGHFTYANGFFYIGGYESSGFSTIPFSWNAIHVFDASGTYISSTSTLIATNVGSSFDGENLWFGNNSGTMWGYQISNGNAYALPVDILCDTAQVIVTVTPVPDTTLVTTPEDTPIDVCTDTETNIQGTITSVTICGQGDNGTVSLGILPCVTYTPDADYVGLDTVCVITCTDLGLCDTTIIVIDVTPVNDPPVAVDDEATTPEDTPVDIDVTANDYDLDGYVDTNTVAVTILPTNGTATVNADGSITYDPDTDFVGTDVFEYAVCDTGMPVLCDTALVTVVVTPVPDTTLVTTPEDTPIDVCTDTETNIQGTITSVTICGQGDNGTVSLGILPCVTYTPDLNYVGFDTVCVITCTDLGLCDTTIIVIDVTPVNDPPVAVDDEATTPEDTPVDIDVTANDYDLDGYVDTNTVAVTILPTNGTTTVNADGSITYDPDTDFVGTDVFEYAVCDTGMPVLCDTALVTVVVTPVPDTTLVTTPEDTPIDVCTDTETNIQGTITSVTICGQGDNGSVSLGVLPCVTYTPDLNYVGFDTVCVITCTDLGLCDTTIIVIDVTPVNDPPVAVDDEATTPEDTPVDIDVTANDYDLDGYVDTNTVAVTILPSNGTATVNADGSITYDPDTDFVGTDVFEYAVCDTGMPVLCDTALVTVVVTPVPDTTLDTTPEDVPLTVCTDPLTNIQGTITSVSVCDGGANGSTVIDVLPCVIYTPDLNYVGLDTICLITCVGTLCDTSIIVIDVTPVNDPPVAVDDEATTPEDTPVDIDVTANDYDLDGYVDTNTVAVTILPTNGTATVNADGSITYDPDTDFVGTDVFEYAVCDTGMPVLCDTALVTVVVTPVTDTTLDTTPEDVPLTICTDPLTNIQGTITSVSVCDGGANGSTVIDALPCVIYTPDLNYVGLDTICLITCVGTLCDTSIIVIDVTPVNDPPVAVDDEATTPEDTPVDIDVTANDYDLDGYLDTNTVSVTILPANGTATVNADGSITYDPDTDFVGTDVFEYAICDTGMPVLCDTALVTVVVTPVTDTTLDTTPEDVPLTICTDPLTNIQGTITSVSVCDGGANGSTVIDALPCVIYTPDLNYVGLDTICLITCVGTLCDTSIIVIDVTPVNDPPVAVDDEATTPEDTPVDIDVTANDFDLDGYVDTNTVAVTILPSNGTATVNADGSITYDPDTDFVGTDVFEYAVCDTGMPVLCDTALVTVVVTPVPDTTLVSTPEDTPIEVCTDTETNIQGTITSVSICGQGDNGTVSLGVLPCVTYSPDLNYVGFDTVCVITCTDLGLCDTTIIIIDVTPVNDPPTAVDDQVTTPEDTPIDIDVTDNDFDIDGVIDVTSVLINNLPENGSVTLDTLTGIFTYTPDLDFVGIDTFSYGVCDTGIPVLCDRAEVIVIVTPVPDTTFDTTPEDVPLLVCTDVLTNIQGTITSVSVCDGGANGSTVIDVLPCVIYTPDPDYFGLDTICLITCVGTLCDTSIIVIDVTPVNDPPTAVDDAVSTPEDTPVDIDVTDNDFDIDGVIDETSVTIITLPNNGGVVLDSATGIVTYTPDLDFVGIDTFTYEVCDTGSPVLCDIAEVVVNVTPVPDTTFDTTPEDVPLTICTDPLTNIQGTITSVSVCDGGANGSTVIDVLPCVIYTPDPDYFGLDTICLITCVGTLCDTSIIVIDVTPVNDPPTAVDDAVSTPEDTPVDIDVTDNDFDIDGVIDETSVTIITLPNNGGVVLDSATGIVTYTPDLDFVGIDTFTYEVCDTGSPVLCDIAEVVVNVTPVPDTTFDTTPEDVPLTICTDPLTNIQGTITSVSVCNGGANGSTVIDVLPCVIYTPDPDYFGLDTICLITCVGTLCDTSIIVIDVTPVNDPPTAVDDAVSTPEDTPVDIDVTDNDFDIDGVIDETSVTIITLPNNGGVVLDSATGIVTYTPDLDFVGIDTFIYEVCDTGSPVLCDIAEVVVNVTPVPDTTFDTTPEDVPLLVCTDVLTNIQGTITSVSVCDGGANGSTVIDVLPCVIYTPDPDYFGLDTICLITCVGTLCDTSIIVIDVTPVNDPPTAVDDAVSTPEDTPVDIDVTDNDFDIDGVIDETSVTIITLPNNGGVVLDSATGIVTYTPDLDFVGIDTFTYEVCDTGSPVLCDIAEVVVNVTPVPDTTFDTTPEDVPLLVCTDVLTNIQGTITSVSVCDGGANGSTVIDVLPCVIYTPDPDYFGLDTICLITCVGTLCDTSIIVIDVTPVNDPPTAVDDAVSTPEDTPVDIDVTDNDFDIDGVIDETSVTIITLPNNGGVVLDSATGIVTYTPDLDFVGIDTFTYEVCDTGSPVLCDIAEVVVNVTPVPDTTFDTTPEDVPLTICTDPLTNIQGTITSVSVCDGGANGSTVIDVLPCVIYTPDPDYFGLDTICLITCVGTLCDTSIIVIDVTPVNDPPTAVDDAVSTPEDTPVDIDVTDNDFDIDGVIDETSVTIITLPNNGGVVLDSATGIVTYTPDLDFVGIDTFTYEVCDTGSPVLCDIAEVVVNVTPVPDTTFDTTPEDVPLLVCTDVLTNIQGTITSVSVCDGGANGSTVIDVLPCVIYTPDPDYFGLDTICLITCVGTLCDTSIIVIDVTPVNDPPTAVDDAVSTPEDTPVDIDVTDNDFDIDGVIDPTTVTIVDDPSNGSVTVDPVTGVVTYSPDLDFVGIDTFQYEVCDTGMPVLCDIAEVIVTVTPVPDTSYAYVLEDSMITVCTDTITNLQNPVSTNICGLPEHGIAVETIFPCIEYTPDPDYFGNDTVCVATCNSDGVCDTSIIIITVIPVNDPPVAVDDVATTPEDTPVDIDVTDNDFDIDGPIDPTTVTIVDDPSNGTVTVDPVTGVVTYDPDLDFVGIDTFQYEVCDTGMPVLCDIAEVVVNVTPVPDTTFDTTPEDVPLTICTDPLTNIQGTITSVSVCDGGANGSTVIDVLPCVIYTPDPDYFGLDTICLITCVGTLCDTSIIVIDVTPVNDPPVAVDDVATTPEDTPVDIDVTDNDFDIDGPIDPTTVTIVDDPSNGTVTVDPVTGVVTYNPDLDFVGIDTFQYEVCDTGMPVLCDIAEVIVNVTPVPDTTFVTTPEDEPITVCTDSLTNLQGTITSVSICGNGANGDVALGTLPCVTYTPAPDYFGMDTVCVITCVGTLCDTTIIVIDVTPVNDPPVAVDDAAETDEDTPVDIDITDNDFDIDGPIDDGSVTIIDGPSNGSVVDNGDGTVTYTPDVDFVGIDVFEYAVCDTGMPVLCDTAEVIVSVFGVIDTSFTEVAEDSSIVICTEDLTNLEGGVAFAYICEKGEFGALEESAGQCFVYIPEGDYFGMDTICLVSCNADGFCDTSIIVIDVTPVNDPPIAVDDQANTPEDTPVDIDVTANDYDIDGEIDPTSVTITEDPSNGSVTVDSTTGVVTYTPDEDFIGIDTFEYAVCDTGIPVLCDTAIVVIHVGPLSDTIYVNVFEDGSIIMCTDSVAQIPGPIITTAACDDPDFGSIAVLPSLCIEYTPDENYNGQDTICVINCNDAFQCDTTIIIITVDPVNDQPVANDDYVETEYVTPVTVDVTANDNDDIDGGEIDPSSVDVITDPVNGTVVNNGDGTVTYTPVENFIGLDSFDYVVCDLGIPLPSLCDTATVYVTVVPTSGDDCFVPQSFSPNGDGLYDYFEIPCAEFFPEMEVMIYNRWGDLVYNSGIGYQNNWNGIWDKSLEDLPDGTYYWIVKFNDDISQDRAGYVLILR